MLIAEAKWIAKQLFLHSEEVFPLLIVGSSTAKFRKTEQPWIDEYIYKPISSKNFKVINSDIKSSEGVDVVFDYNNPDIKNEFVKLEFKSVLCSNVLEHLSNKEEFCKLITSIIPEGNYIIVTCPYKYPYHPDPIDNKYRPTVEELARLFPYTKLVKGEIITCRNYLYYLKINLQKLLRVFVRILFPFYNPRGWLIVIGYLKYLFTNFKVTCIVLKKCNH